VERTLTDYAAYVGYTHTLTFDLTVIDPCPTAIYTRDTITPTAYSYTIWDSTLVISFTAFTSDIADLVCGTFNYVILDETRTALDSSIFTVNGNSVEVYTNAMLPASAKCGAQPIETCEFEVFLEGY